MPPSLCLSLQLQEEGRASQGLIQAHRPPRLSSVLDPRRHFITANDSAFTRV